MFGRINKERLRACSFNIYAGEGELKLGTGGIRPLLEFTRTHCVGSGKCWQRNLLLTLQLITAFDEEPWGGRQPLQGFLCLQGRIVMSERDVREEAVIAVVEMCSQKDGISERQAAVETMLAVLHAVTVAIIRGELAVAEEFAGDALEMIQELKEAQNV